MKIIHCADLHLDSAMAALPKEKAAQRKAELLGSFQRMVKYGRAHGVRAILISGDLFDTATKRQTRIKKQVASIIRGADEIDFLYLRGNHDAEDFFPAEDDRPENLKTFAQDEWTSFEYGDVVVTGRETGAGAIGAEVYGSLSLDKTKTNIVMLHGQIAGALVKAKDGASLIDLKRLEGEGIDYLALGHVHKRDEGALGRDGAWACPGCLEGRGFDECGEKGFIALDITGKKIARSFVKCAARTIHEVEARLEGSPSFDEIKDAIQNALDGIPSEDMVKVALRGEVSEDAKIDTYGYLQLFAGNFFFLKICDETSVLVDWEKYRGDVSLKGFFIRKVESDGSLSARDKGEVIRMALRALSSEEV